MASATTALGANFRDKIIKMAALRLADVASGETTNYVEIIMGTGNPSGAYHLDTGVPALYLKQDATGRSDLLWFTVNGGTGWSQWDDGGQPMASENLGAPAAASDTACHALYAGNAGDNNFPGPWTNPDTARGVVVDFQASWDGGDVTVTGLDAFGGAQVEVFTAAPGSTVVGSAIFSQVDSATKGAVGSNAAGASIGTGVLLGLMQTLTTPVGVLAVDGVTEVATWDNAEGSVKPTTAPDGAKTFTALHG